MEIQKSIGNHDIENTNYYCSYKKEYRESNILPL